VSDARFLTPDDRLKAIERLRANQTGVGSTHFKWKQAAEVFYDIKTVCFVGIPLLINAGTAVASAFGPTLIRNFGFVSEDSENDMHSTAYVKDKYVSSLLNIPFGILQLGVILFSSWAALKVKSKAIPLACLQVPGIIGCALLYHEGTSGNFRQPVALVGYYLLAFNFGCNPLIVSWMVSLFGSLSQGVHTDSQVANTAGQTKKSVIMAIYNASAAAGNIIGKYTLNHTAQQLTYRPAAVQRQRCPVLHPRYQGCSRYLLCSTRLCGCPSCRALLPKSSEKASESCRWKA
jgi:hypothetical protein